MLGDIWPEAMKGSSGGIQIARITGKMGINHIQETEESTMSSELSVKVVLDDTSDLPDET
jgi:hypothetical protein